MRNFNRKHNELRKVKIETLINPYAEGSCLISFGQTKVICTASVESKVPNWLLGSKSGWITAEYSMLPRATEKRTSREVSSFKRSGRTMEIQRLIGRSLRSVIDLNKMPGISIILDCDVIQADGGTRTASITGAFVSVKLAIKELLSENKISSNPINDQLAAVSCGIVNNTILLDLDYAEDSMALADVNFVLSKSLKISEVQASGEKSTFSKKQFDEMYELAAMGVKELFTIQSTALDE